MRGRLDFARDGAHWPNREASRFVEAGAIRWHLQEMGAGEPLLLLHGTGASTHSWAGVMPLLARAWRVLAVDLPGHGFTSRPHGGAASLPAMAQAVHALLEELALLPRAIIGHSAGAAVAIRMVLDFAVRPQRIIGINAALLPFPGLAGRVFPALARALFLNPFASHVVARRASDPDRVDRLLDSTGSHVPDWSRAIYRTLFANPFHVDSTLGMMAKWDLVSLFEDMARLPVPVSLIVGEADRTVPPAGAERMAARIPHADICRLPGLGHLAQEEAPETVARLINQLLETAP